jgi:hypothetical protein
MGCAALDRCLFVAALFPGPVRRRHDRRRLRRRSLRVRSSRDAKWAHPFTAISTSELHGHLDLASRHICQVPYRAEAPLAPSAAYAYAMAKGLPA